MTFKLYDVETPAFVVDVSQVEKNIAAFQAHCNAKGLKLRPHIKTHKLVHFAKAQITAGAAGITCQKIGEAEIMADAGIDDILITYNIVGASKLQRLIALAKRVKRLAVTADHPAVISGLSDAFETAGLTLDVLIECDTGAGRCGVQSPEQAVELAEAVEEAPGLCFRGLMTYPAPGGQADVVAFMTKTKSMLEAKGLPCAEVSSGGSPDMWSADTGGVITEYRIGTYIYNDRSLIERGTCSLDDCAGRVLATVVSRPAPDRAIIDAGSKALTSDLLGLTGHGLIVGHPDLAITSLSEEHGIVKSGEAMSLNVGDRIEIIPNHVCVVSNMFDYIWFSQPDGTLERVRVDARGTVT